MKYYKYILAAFTLLIFASCAEQEIDDFSLSAEAIDEYLDQRILKHQSYLKIKNGALGRDFMFYGSFIPMLKSPTGHSLRGRIINFQVFSDRVVMLESPKGLSLAQKDQSVILLAEFPIVAREADGIVIDFAKGMKNAFTTRNVHSNAQLNTDDDGSEQFSSLELTISFIKSIVTEDDVLTISQIAQWRNKSAESVSAEFRYFLRAYDPSQTFAKKVFEKNRHVLYFSTPPRIEAPTSKPFAYVAKWDITKPITFYLSQNTPSEYAQAITDGILYWNHIFGKELLRAEMLTSDISAPHHHLNIVQWVPWDNEPSAYADMVVDHLTGETLQAQIYLRSGWIFESAKKMRRNLQELLLENGGSPSPTSLEEGAPMPDMFSYDEPCLKTLSGMDAVGDLAQHLGSREISDEVLKNLASDVLRAVVAHEMGHVLGLRHNLSASTDGNLGIKERNSYLRTYLSDANPPLGQQKYLTKSVMDVFSASDDALIGSQIRALSGSDFSDTKLADIFSYDRDAINYGYFDQPMPGNTPYCSDDDLTTFIDCRRWDFSNTPLLYDAWMLNNTMTRVSFALAETFIEAIKPERKGGPMKIKDVPITSQGVLHTVQESLKGLVSWFHQNSRSVQVETNFAAYGPQNKEKIEAKKYKNVREQIEQEGLGHAIFGMLPPFNTTGQEMGALVKKFKTQFLTLIEEEKREHPSFLVSPEEMAQAEEIAHALFSNINQDIIRLSALLMGHAQFDDPAYQEPVEAALGTIAKELILAHQKEKLPKFTYSQKIRDAATGLLRPGLGLLPDWSLETMSRITNELKQLMLAYGGSQKKQGIDLAELDRSKRAWLLEQNQVLAGLRKASTMSRDLNPLPSSERPRNKNRHK